MRQPPQQQRAAWPGPDVRERVADAVAKAPESWGPCLTLLQTRNARELAVSAWSADGSVLATGGVDGRVVLW